MSLTPEQAVDLLDKHAADLGEFFDHVQIMVTWDEDGICKCQRRGVGNWYARQGMAHEFINADIAQEQAKHISEAIQPPEQDTPL